MGRPPSRLHHLAIGGLGVIALCQFVLLGRTFGGIGSETPEWLQAGGDVSGIRVDGMDGQPMPLSGEGLRVVLVFHSECGHCAAVAPEWRSWLEEDGRAWDVLAVTSEPVESGRAFASRNGWMVGVATVETDSQGGTGGRLTGRTPWVFVVDPEGIINAEGHGSRLLEIVAAAGQGPGGPRGQ